MRMLKMDEWQYVKSQDKNECIHKKPEQAHGWKWRWADETAPLDPEKFQATT